MKDINDPKYREYYERHSFWQNTSISHLSFSINLFLTITIAFLGFVVSNENLFTKELTPTLNNADMRLSIIVSAVMLGGFSVFSGIICTLLRIADLRLTRNAIYTRKWFYSKYKEENIDAILSEKKRKNRGNLFCVTFFTPCYFTKTHSNINKAEYNSAKKLLDTELENVSYWKFKIGDYTWITHKTQILLFFSFIVLWIISVFN